MADEYIRKTDAIKQCGFGMTSLHIADNFRKMRPADVVQVVRCKDCERSEYDVVFESYWCKLKRLVKPDDFCSYGKRREE